MGQPYSPSQPIDPSVALKYDQTVDKIPWDLLPIYAVEGMLQVLLYGKRKYSVCADCGSKIYPNPRLTDGDPPRDDCPQCHSPNIADGAWNWRKGFIWSRIIASLYRHLGAIIKGEMIDPESGLQHVDHLHCCVVFLSEHIKDSLGRDNLYYHGKDK